MSDNIEKVEEVKEENIEESKKIILDLTNKIQDLNIQTQELKKLVQHYIEREKRIQRQLVYLSHSIETARIHIPED